MKEDISLNFGAIRDSVSRLASQEILKENKNNSLKIFIQKVKKSPVLMKQHLVFKNFEDCKPFLKENLAERFINQNLNVLRGINWRDILKENRDLRIGLLENSHVESNGGAKNDLFNHIQTLIESVTRPDYSKINKSQESYEFLLEYLTRKVEDVQTSPETKDSPDFSNWEFITKMAVNNFNKRYAHLGESEKKIFEMLISESDKKKNYIEDLKKENLGLINELLKVTECIEGVKMLEEFKAKIESDKKPDGFTYDDFILAYSELNESLQEIKKGAK
jgi:hypothetical protein